MIEKEFPSEGRDGSQANVPDVRMINMTLWRSDVVVLFDWLMSVDMDDIPVTHPARKQALMDLLTRIETETDASIATQKDINEAQTEVARDMGW